MVRKIMKKETTPPTPAALRRRAKKKLKEQPDRLSELSARDMKHLITELSTHQIELEMQNEELRRAQIRLEQSCNRYAELYDYAPVGYFTLDARGIIREVNKTGADLLGLDKHLLQGKPFPTFLLNKEDLQIFRAHQKKVFLKQSLQSCEVGLARGKGQRLYVRLQSAAADNVDEKAGLIRMSVIDITERILAEEASAENEHRYRSLFNGMTQGFALHELLDDEKGEPADCRFLEVNPAFEQMIGLRKSDLIGRTKRQVFPRDDPSWIKKYAAVAQTCLPAHFETWSLTLDKHYDVYAYCPAPRHVAALFLDITERVRAEQALRESEERLQLAVSAANLAIWEWDPVKDRSIKSDIYQAQYGRPPENASCHEWWTDRVHPEERDRVVAGLNAAMAGSKDSWAAEYRFRRVDGSWAYVYDHSRISRDESGKPVRLVGGVLDLTARKKLEEALKQTNAELETVNKELESFSYAVANDLRTPLRSIEGFSRAILEDYADRLDDTGKDFCRRIQDATLRMTQLIEALWTMSRLTSGELAENVVDLSAASHIITRELKKKQPGRRADFIIAEGVKVKGDTDMLLVVLENLLDNAWKFTSRHPSAAIEFGVAEHDGTRAYFVRDNGAGFDTAFVDRLFRPFQRLHTDSEFPGIGIGLAIAATIIKRHGGRMWAEGGVEKGATFFFTL